jgi:hypothetical protein
MMWESEGAFGKHLECTGKQEAVRISVTFLGGSIYIHIRVRFSWVFIY